MRHGDAEVTAAEGGAVSMKRRVHVGLWKSPLVLSCPLGEVIAKGKVCYYFCFSKERNKCLEKYVCKAPGKVSVT